MYSNSIHPRFDVTTLETLEASFAKAKEESYANDDGWTWLNCDMPLYISCKNRLLKKLESERETIKNKRAKR